MYGYGYVTYEEFLGMVLPADDIADLGDPADDEFRNLDPDADLDLNVGVDLG